MFFLINKKRTQNVAKMDTPSDHEQPLDEPEPSTVEDLIHLR